MRTAIVAAIAAILFQTILIVPTLALAQAASDIQEQIITVNGEGRPPSQGTTKATNDIFSASSTRHASGTRTSVEDFIVPVSEKGPMGYLGSSAHGYLLDYIVMMMFSREIMHDVQVQPLFPPAVDPKPAAPAGDIFTNKSTEDIFRDLFIGSYEPPPPGPIVKRSPAPANPALFIVALADSSINSDTALLIAGVPLVKGFPRTTQAKLFRIQLTKLSNGTHFCAPSDHAFVSTPRVSVSNAGRLFVAFDADTVGSVLSFDLAALMAGGPVKVKCFTGATLQGLTPPRISDGGKIGYFVAAPILGSVIKRFRFTTGADPVNDRLVATPDINVTSYSYPPAAVQPNGAHLYSGASEFRVPSVQIGNVFWNVHTIDDGSGHSRIRLYKFSGAGTTPLMELTLTTGTGDDLFAPSLDVMTTPMKRAYVTFARTIAGDATTGKATLMQARGPSGSSTGWKSFIVAKSPAQISKTFFGTACDTFQFAGCAFMANTGTWVDPINSVVWSIGPLIINGDGTGKEINWQLKGVGRPQ